MGLSVMLFADTKRYFMPSAFFEGFKVLVHHPNDFPSIKEDGFAVAPGTETFVAVDAFGEDMTTPLFLMMTILNLIDVYSTHAVQSVDAQKRYCYFYDENAPEFYHNYTRSNCLMECATKLMRHLCGCQPYYYPVRGDDMKICTIKDIPCLHNHAGYVRMLSFPTDEMKEILEKAGLEDCNCLGCEWTLLNGTLILK